jgi:hypothetical protein
MSILVTFTKDFDYREPDDWSTIFGYTAGTTLYVSEGCAHAAVLAGCADYEEEDDGGDA